MSWFVILITIAIWLAANWALLGLAFLCSTWWSTAPQDTARLTKTSA